MNRFVLTGTSNYDWQTAPVKRKVMSVQIKMIKTKFVKMISDRANVAALKLILTIHFKIP